MTQLRSLGLKNFISGFDSKLIHIGLDEVITNTKEYVSSCEGNFSIEQTKEIIIALQKLVDQYEAQQV